MLTPCLDPNFAAHLNAFYAEAIEATRAWFIGLNAATIVLLMFAAAVITFIVAVSAGLTRCSMRAPGLWISPDVDDSDGPRATEANSVVIALAILLVGMSDMWAR